MGKAHEGSGGVGTSDGAGIHFAEDHTGRLDETNRSVYG